MIVVVILVRLLARLYTVWMNLGLVTGRLFNFPRHVLRVVSDLIVRLRQLAILMVRRVRGEFEIRACPMGRGLRLVAGKT